MSSFVVIQQAFAANQASAGEEEIEYASCDSVGGGDSVA
jgi:hypothetical protein